MPPKCSGRSDLERSSLSQANAEATAAVDGIRLRARAAPVEEPLYARLATRIKVFWPDEPPNGAWFAGYVVGYDPATQKTTVAYDDGEEEELLLGPGTKEEWRLEEDGPEEEEEEEGEEEEAEAAAIGASQKPRKQLRHRQAGRRGGCRRPDPSTGEGRAGAEAVDRTNRRLAGETLAEFYAQLGPHLVTYEASGGQAPHRVLQGAAGLGPARLGDVLKSEGVVAWNPVKPLEPCLTTRIPLAMTIARGLHPDMPPGQDVRSEVEVRMLVPAGTPGVAPGDAAAGTSAQGAQRRSAAAAAAAAGVAAATRGAAGGAAAAGGTAGEGRGSQSASPVPGRWLEVAAVTTQVKTLPSNHCHLSAIPLAEPLRRAVPGGYLLAAVVVGSKQGAAGAGSSSQAARAGGRAQPHLELYVVPEALVAPHNPGGDGEMENPNREPSPPAPKRRKAAAGSRSARHLPARPHPHPSDVVSLSTSDEEDTGAKGSGGPAAGPNPRAPGDGAHTHPGRGVPDPAAPGGSGGRPAPGGEPALVLPDVGDFMEACTNLLRLLRAVLTQVQDLRHQGLMRLLASRDQRQQQALLGLDYPQLQLVVAQGDVTAVANMIQALSDSLIR